MGVPGQAALLWLGLLPLGQAILLLTVVIPELDDKNRFSFYIVNILVDNKDRSLPGSSLEKLIQTVARHLQPFSASPYNLKS